MPTLLRPILGHRWLLLVMVPMLIASVGGAWWAFRVNMRNSSPALEIAMLLDALVLSALVMVLFRSFKGRPQEEPVA